MKAACGNTDPKDDASFPVDGDGDGICDILDFKSLTFELNGLQQTLFEGVEGEGTFQIVANLSGMTATSWETEPELPVDYLFSEGNISVNNPLIAPLIKYTIWANNSITGISLEKEIELVVLADLDGDGLPNGPTSTNLIEDEDDDGDGIDDVDDQCAQGVTGWTSDNSSDYDSDGCKDANPEDDDDDNDLVLDDNDLCPYGIIGLTVQNDTDRDGCVDTFEPINVGLNSVFASVTGQENTTYEWELDPNSTLPDFFSLFNEGNETYLQSNSSTTNSQETYQLTFNAVTSDTEKTNMTIVFYGNLTIVYSPTIYIDNSEKEIITVFENNSRTEIYYLVPESPDGDDESLERILMTFSIVIILLVSSLFVIILFRRKQDGGSAEPKTVINIGQQIIDTSQTQTQNIDQSQVLHQTQNVDQSQEIHQTQTNDNRVTHQSIVGDGNVQISGGGDVNAVVNQTQTVNTSPRPGNPIDEFALWCMERLKMNGPKKIGDQTMLIPPEDVMKNIGESTTIDLKISIALNYPENWEKAGAAPARAEIDKFLRELAYIEGKFDVGTGFFVHGGEGATKDIQVEYSGTFSSVQSPTSLASLLGLIRSAIWEYCDVLIQRSVFVQIGPHISDCVNPCPLEKVKNIKHWLDNGMEHIDLPRESFEQTIKPERASS